MPIWSRRSWLRRWTVRTAAGRQGASMAVVKRSAVGLRRATRSSNRATQARRARARTGRIVDALMGLLPFTEEPLHRIFLFIILGVVAAAAWFIASITGFFACIGRGSCRERVCQYCENSV